MMKLISFILCFECYEFYAPELLWGFEDWELVNGIETPMGWNVNHTAFIIDTLVNRFTKTPLK